MIAYPAFNSLVEGPFFSFVEELFSRRIETLPYSHVIFFNLFTTMAYTYFNPSENKTIYLVSWTISFLSFISALLFLLFTFETRGLEELEVFRKLGFYEDDHGNKIEKVDPSKQVEIDKKNKEKERKKLEKESKKQEKEKQKKLDKEKKKLEKESKKQEKERKKQLEKEKKKLQSKKKAQKKK